MNDVVYSLTNYTEIAPRICQLVGGDLSENYYTYDRELGKALVEFYDYTFFSLMFSRFKANEDVKISRTSSSIKGYFAFDVLLRGYSGNFLTQINDKLNRFHAGCYISTPSTESYCIYEAGNNYDLISVIIQKDWLESFLGEALPSILQNPDAPLYIFTPLSRSLAASLSVLHQSDPKASFRKPYLYAKTLESITLAIESLKVGQKEYRQHGFSPEELETMFKLSNWLQDHTTEDTSIQSLSYRFGLNRNKLQSMFKSIFGQTLGEYTRSLKMQKAYELLYEHYSVAEVGHRLGYSNLSHFSRAFKKVYGFNPSEVNNKN